MAKPALSNPTSSAPLPGKFLGFALAFSVAAAGFGLAKLPYLSIMGPLSLALLIGIVWRAGLGVPERAWSGIKFSSRPLLRSGIVLMGARLDYGVLLAAGPKILGIALTVIAVTITGMYALGRRLGLSRELGMLMAVGTGICGASAVAAASTVTRANEEDTTLAVAMMGLLGTAGVFFYIAVGGMLSMTPRELGVLTGGTLHEVAQVVAAAFTWGTVSGDMGTMVKLTRVVLLAPALVLVGWYWRRISAHDTGNAGFSFANPPVPYFVMGFLAVGGLNSLGTFSPGVQSALTQASIALMAIAMAAMGLATDMAQIRRAGMPAVTVGVVGFIGLVALVFSLIKFLQV